MSKKSIYDKVIKTLQQNDKNATYDEIFIDMEYNLENAINLLYECLHRVVYDDGLEGEEMKFYRKQLYIVSTIK